MQSMHLIPPSIPLLDSGVDAATPCSRSQEAIPRVDLESMPSVHSIVLEPGQALKRDGTD